MVAEGYWELEFRKVENEGEKNQGFYFEILKVAISGCWDLKFSCEREKRKRLGVWERQCTGSMKVKCGCFICVFFGETDVPFFFWKVWKICDRVLLPKVSPLEVCSVLFQSKTLSFFQNEHLMHIYSLSSKQAAITLSFFLEWALPFQPLIYLEPTKKKRKCCCILFLQNKWWYIWWPFLQVVVVQ